MFKNIFSKNISIRSALALGLVAAMTQMAWAEGSVAAPAVDASTLGDMFCNMFVNLQPMGLVFQWFSYVAGTAFTAWGIYHLRNHTEHHREHPIHKGLMALLGAACLLALPSIVDTLITTLYGTQGTAGSLTCTANNNASSGQVLDVMLTNFINNIKSPMIALTSLIAIVSGLYMIIHGLIKASKYGQDPRTHSVHSIISHLVFGAILMTVGENLNLVLASTFGPSTDMAGATVSPNSVLQWQFVSSVGGGSQQFANAIAAALNFVQVIGVISFVRGWMIMKKVSETGGSGGATMAAGITHILGGCAAINIGAFVKIVDTTMGTGLM